MKNKATQMLDKKPNNNKRLFIGIIIGLVGAFIISYLFNLSIMTKFNTSQSTDEIEIKEKSPLYWVAPMDPNYKRNKAGKSPMGMDLVPVYANKNAHNSNQENEVVGTISISPNVINNLGVRTVIAQWLPLNNEINTVGYVTYDEDKLVHIHPRVDGWIEKLYVKAIGAFVKKDQPLYALYSPELVNAQEEFLMALQRKNERLVNAAENRLVTLQFPMSAIETLKKSRTIQQHITFYAPQNGVIENLNIREGFFVKPGSTLMSIGDLSQVWIDVEVFERQASQVLVGTNATLKLDYLPGKEFFGQVDFIYPTLDAKTRTMKVRLRFDNTSGDFKPNMFAQVTLHTNDPSPALLIPKEALIRTGKQDRVVLALGNGNFKSIAVIVGRFNATSVEIISGLKAGETIVSSAQFLLDSESSKTSDFMRMHYDKPKLQARYSSAQATGKINSIITKHRIVNISRSAIEKWQRPAATVDFVIDASLKMSDFHLGEQINFTFEVQGDDFVITEFVNLAYEAQE